jgi:hypothetical protein
MENWIAEKLQLATEESYKDPANIQSKHQKHQAFEAELAANADRIQSVLAMGQNLIDKHQCAGSEEAVQVGRLAVYNVFSYVEHACLFIPHQNAKSLHNFKFNVVMMVLSSYNFAYPCFMPLFSFFLLLLAYVISYFNA